MSETEIVLFIHGSWATPFCWRYFEPYFGSRGFRTLTPAWPLKDRPIDEQLAHPDPRLALIGIPEIVAHYKAIIRALDKPPILIGHSFGGLIVQLLLDQGFGAAGIALNSVPPCGVSPVGFSWHTVKRLRLLFGTPFSWRKVLPLPEHELAELELRRAQGIELHLVPESGRIFWQLLSPAAAVDFRNHERAPLLLVGCGQDTCSPAEVQRRNWAAYRLSTARTDFAFFPELTHLSIAEPGHEGLAAYCAAWIRARLAQDVTTTVAGEVLSR
jgi:pimeloyl-ACP methyl ester carboxylesterase